MPEVRSVCFGAEKGDGACRYFRGEIPAKALAALGWETSVSAYMLTPQTKREIKNDPRIRGWGGPGTEIDQPADIVTLRIMDDVVVDPDSGLAANNYRMDSMAADIRRARAAGQVVLYDVDDDIWNIPLWSPASRAMHKLVRARAVDLDVVNANITACDGVITPTRYLADELRNRFPAMQVYVLPPGIDPAPYEGLGDRTPGRTLHVGWMGSISHHLAHLRSMQVALDCLPALNAAFVRLGSIPGDRGAFLLDEVPCLVYEAPWGGVDELPAKLTGLDVGIIPRVAERFHEGQSITSGLQYAAAGVPFIASKTAEYEALWRQGCGDVVETIGQWRRQLTGLLSNDQLRQDIAKGQRAIAFKEYGLEATGRRYDDLFSSLL
jgi:glycosyltransferase involved in cell wall biosynthesis